MERFSRICHEDTLQWAMDIAGDTTSFMYVPADVDTWVYVCRCIRVHVQAFMMAPFTHPPPKPPAPKNSPAYLVDEGARDTPVSAAAAKAAQLEQEEMQEMQTAAAAARGDGRGEESDEDDDDEERGYCVGRKDSFCAMISRIPTPQDLPTPKHLPLPPTPEGVPATAIVAIDENSQPVLVIPPPPTVRQPKQKRWMKIEGQ